MTDVSIDAAAGGLLSTVFGPVVRPRTYSRILYLLIGFPLGLLWFVLYVTSGALGLGLLVLGIGAVILLLAILAARPFGTLERGLATGLIGVEIPRTPALPPVADGFGRWLKAAVSSGHTWTSLAFLLLRFPLGLASWIVAVVTISLSWGFILAPLAPPFGGEIRVFSQALEGAETLFGTAAGLVLWLLTVHLLNGLAILWGRLARALLGGTDPARPDGAGTAIVHAPSRVPVPA